MLVPGLEERARFLPRLDRCLQLTPGYLDAPATALAPLGQLCHIGRRGYPDVTLVFCAIDKWVRSAGRARGGIWVLARHGQSEGSSHGVGGALTQRGGPAPSSWAPPQ